MPVVRRRRTRQACAPCHARKRKCDGHEPCSTCQRDEYDCYFSGRARAQLAMDTPRSPKTNTNAISFSKGTSSHSSLRPNSGLLFLRQLLTQIDPANPPKKRPVAWNVGLKTTDTSSDLPLALCITDILSHAQMLRLTSIYFDKVDPCYGFIERDEVLLQIDHRWTEQSSFEHCDATLCGIAALGSYFSKEFATPAESQLVRLAKSILDSSSSSETPDLEIVTAWICHVIYLRLTTTPFPAWLASCTAMHILEAAGIHDKGQPREGSVAQSKRAHSPHILRRAFGVAQHLNTWISYELGLTRVNLECYPTSSTAHTDVNYTDKLLELLPYSLRMENTTDQDDECLRSMLALVTTKDDHQPPLIMAQCNLLLCILRQLSARNALRTIDNHELESVLSFLAKGLRAARRMVKDDVPWHHLANVPFQTLCILLVIDTPASLTMVGDVMQTIRHVTQAYNTAVLNDAYNTACFVLSLHRKRRLHDAKIIEDVLSELADGRETMPSTDRVPSEVDWSAPDETEVTWLKDLMNEFPSLQDFDVSGMWGSTFVNDF